MLVVGVLHKAIAYSGQTTFPYQTFILVLVLGLLLDDLQLLMVVLVLLGLHLGYTLVNLQLFNHHPVLVFSNHLCLNPGLLMRFAEQLIQLVFINELVELLLVYYLFLQHHILSSLILLNPYHLLLFRWNVIELLLRLNLWFDSESKTHLGWVVGQSPLRVVFVQSSPLIVIALLVFVLVLHVCLGSDLLH